MLARGLKLGATALCLCGLVSSGLIMLARDAEALTPPVKTLRQRIMESEAVFLGTIEKFVLSPDGGAEIHWDDLELIGSQTEEAPHRLFVPGHVETEMSGESVLWTRHTALVKGGRYLIFLGIERVNTYNVFTAVPMHVNGSYIECDRYGSLLYSVSMASLHCWRPEMVFGNPQNVSQIAKSLRKIWRKVKKEGN